MARNLVISFLSALPPSILGRFEEAPLQITCPIAQRPKCSCKAGLPDKACGKNTCPEGQGLTVDIPGGREGYAKWLSSFAQGRKIIPGIAAAAGLQPGEKIGRVCVMGFSNGCIGVHELLKYEDSNKIDTVIFCDGVHGSWGSGQTVQPFQYKEHVNHAIGVMQQNPDQNPNARVMIVTHSSIVPGAMPSTTQTADVIWSEAMTMAPADYVGLDCGEACAPVRHMYDMLSENAGPSALCASYCPSASKDAPSYSFVDGCSKCASGCCAAWENLEDSFYDRRVANNFYVLGWGDLGGSDPTTRDKYAYGDHHFQARVVLPAVLQEFVVKRWNKACTGPVAGFGAEDDPEVGICKPEEGISYDDATDPKIDYVPDLTPETPALEPCPLPGSGEILTGSKLDRCAVSDGGQQSPPVVNKLLTGPQILAGLTALAGGYTVGRYGSDIIAALKRRLGK